MYGAIAVFVVTYVVIAVPGLVGRGLDRPAAALIGAVAMVAVGGLGLEPALAAIDLHVLVLLVGVLVIAAYLQESRFFRWAAYQVLTRARSARSLLVGLTLVAAALSALLVNDTVCLVLTPLVVAVTVEAGLPVLPYLLALATAANLGGVVTFSGNPQNMLIGHAAGGHPGFAAYLALTLPAGLACVAVNARAVAGAWMFHLVWGAPMWLVDAAQTGVIVPSSLAAHAGPLLLGGWWLFRRPWPGPIALPAWMVGVAEMIVARPLTDPAHNVNAAYRVWPPMDRYTSSVPLMWAVMTLTCLGLMVVVDTALVRRRGARR